MPWGFAALAVGGIASAAIGSSAASSAAKTQANAANRASDIELQMFHETQANEAPYLAAGGNALAELMKELGLSGGNTSGVGRLNKPFSLADFQSSPGYKFQLQQGEQAVLDNASRMGGVNSGNTLKELTRYGEGVANQDYWNAYNAYVQRQNQGFSQLQTIAGSGQNAAANLGAIGSATAGRIGENTIGAGNAISAGQVGSAQALSGGIGNASNYLFQALMSQNSPAWQPPNIAVTPNVFGQF